MSTATAYYGWFYPSINHDGLAGFSYRGSSEPGEPPSVELRALIEADAPWYVVLDKLIEEYPQWESRFNEVAARCREQQEVADATARN